VRIVGWIIVALLIFWACTDPNAGPTVHHLLTGLGSAGNRLFDSAGKS
jgi:hypothetical protein